MRVDYRKANQGPVGTCSAMWLASFSCDLFKQNSVSITITFDFDATCSPLCLMLLSWLKLCKSWILLPVKWPSLGLWLGPPMTEPQCKNWVKFWISKLLGCIVTNWIIQASRSQVVFCHPWSLSLSVLFTIISMPLKQYFVMLVPKLLILLNICAWLVPGCNTSSSCCLQNPALNLR